MQIVPKLTTEADSMVAGVVGRGMWYNSVHGPAPVCTMYRCTGPLVVTVPPPVATVPAGDTVVDRPAAASRHTRQSRATSRRMQILHYFR